MSCFSCNIIFLLFVGFGIILCELCIRLVKFLLEIVLKLSIKNMSSREGSSNYKKELENDSNKFNL